MSYIYNLYLHGSCKQQETEKDRFFRIGQITNPQTHNVFSNMSRASGQQIASRLTYDYAVNPADALAESLVPHVWFLTPPPRFADRFFSQLKAGDCLLYHSIKLYQLNPELHWTAGGLSVTR
jgi:hypothetical protein